MVVHIGLRDMFASVVKDEQNVFLSEAALSTIFSCVANTPEEQEDLDRLRAHAEHLAVLHKQERGIDKELAVALYQHYRLSDASKLLDELRACAPTVLEQQATLAPAADVGKWLRWYKDPRSWSGYSFAQYLQDTDTSSQSSAQKVPNKPGPQAPMLKGPRPANVTQAVVQRLQATVNAEECEAACAAVNALQAQLADVQQQQEDVHAQLTEGWRSVLRAAFAPIEQPLALHLIINPDGPALQHMQQQLEESQIQLAAAQQEVAAARQRAEAAEAALHQQWQQVAAAEARALTAQQPAVVLAITILEHVERKQQEQQQQQQAEGSQLLALQERLAAVEAGLAAHQQQQQQQTDGAADAVAQQGAGQLLAVTALSGDGGSTAQQPDTPAFRELEGGQAALPLPLLATHMSPCSSSGSNTSHKSRSCQSGQPQAAKDAAGVPAPGGHSSAAEQQRLQQQLGTDSTALSGDLSAAAAVDQLQQAPAGLTLSTQQHSRESCGLGGSTGSSKNSGPHKASDSPTDAFMQHSAEEMGHQQAEGQLHQHEQGAGFGAGELAASHRSSSAGSVCSSTHSRRSSAHSNSSLAAVLGSNGVSDFWGMFGTGGTGVGRLSAGGSRRGSVVGLGGRGGSSSGNGSAAVSASLPEPAAAAVLGGPPSFLSVLAARLSQNASLFGGVVPAAAAPAPVESSARPSFPPAGAVAVARVSAAEGATCRVGMSAGTGPAAFGDAHEAEVSSGSCSTSSSSVGVIGPLLPEKAMALV